MIMAALCLVSLSSSFSKMTNECIDRHDADAQIPAYLSKQDGVTTSLRRSVDLQDHTTRAQLKNITTDTREPPRECNLATCFLSGQIYRQRF